MANKSTKSTGLGADAFFQSPASTQSKSKPASFASPNSSSGTPTPVAPVEDKSERRSFNLRLSTLRLLDEVQIKTMRDGDKWTLSAIVERGIERVAQEMGVSVETNMRVKEHSNQRTGERPAARINE